MATTPASQAMGYVSQIPGAVGPYYNPYIQSGQGANQNLSGGLGSVFNNPVGAYNQVAGSYQMSPYAQNQINAETTAINNTAAAGGYAGSPYNQQQVGQMVQGLTSKDENEYINSVMGLWHMGLLGEEDLDNLGFNASSKMADVTGNTLNTEGGLAFANQSEKNAMHRNRMSNILGLTGMGVGALASPLGSMFGGNTSSAWVNPDSGQRWGG